MRVYSAAIFTLATLAVSNITTKASAETPNNEAETKPNGSVVVPITEETPAQVGNVAAPETEEVQQFSQNLSRVESGTNNNSPVITTIQNREVNKSNKFNKSDKFDQKENSQSVISSSPQPQKAVSEINQPTAKPQSNSSNTIPDNSDLVVPAVEVQIIGATQELQPIIREVIKTQVGGDTNQSQLQKDVTAILNTGLFSNATVSSSETPVGLKVLYRVEPLIVRSLQLSGAKALKYQVAIEPFKSQIGKPISPSTLKNAVKELNF